MKKLRRKCIDNKVSSSNQNCLNPIASFVMLFIRYLVIRINPPHNIPKISIKDIGTRTLSINFSFSILKLLIINPDIATAMRPLKSNIIKKNKMKINVLIKLLLLHQRLKSLKI